MFEILHLGRQIKVGAGDREDSAELTDTKIIVKSEAVSVK